MPAGGPPPVFVVGAGGFGAEVVEYLGHVLQASTAPAFVIGGVVDDHLRGPAPHDIAGAPFLGRIADVAAVPGARFVVATGHPRFRRETLDQLRGLGLPLHTLVHPTALVSPTAVLGEGAIVAPFATVSSHARVGAGCVLNVYCLVAHDAVLGDCAVLSPYAALAGWARVGAQSFLGTRATVLPKVSVGEQCMINAHSFVKADVADRMLVSVRGEYRVIRARP